MASWDFDAAVIGAGPGGLVSALYLGRFLRSTALFGAGTPRASWIPRTHNLLGYRGGISGAELLKRLERQVNEVGVERIHDRVRLEKISGGFVIHGENHEFTARKVILATGMQDVQPTIPRLDHLRRRGLLRYCPVCDGYEYRGLKIGVLAQDEHGLKTAVFLSSFSPRVEVIWPPSQPIPVKLNRACEEKGIRIRQSELIDIEEREGGKRGLWLSLKNNDGRACSLQIDVCYVAMGIVVNDFAFRGLKGLTRSPEGFLIADDHQRVGVPGLFAVGDCVESLAQIVVAAGQAAVAATRIHNDLRSET